MSLERMRELYDYHRWANRRLFEVATALGEDVVARDVGRQFSYPIIRRIFGHLYGADRIWLSRWKGVSLTMVPGDEFATLGSIRGPWDELEVEQREFLDALTPDDLEQIYEFRNQQGKLLRFPLEPQLYHVINHATHHRSEIATMITMVSSSPPDTGLNAYLIAKSGQ